MKTAVGAVVQCTRDYTKASLEFRFAQVFSAEA